MLFAALDIEDALYRKYQNFVTVPNSLFRIHVYLHQGDSITLSDGALVKNGDLVIALHLWNSRLRKFLANVPREQRREVFLNEVQRSCTVLADYLEADSRFARYTALRARTLLGYLVEKGRWPFDRFPVPNTFRTRLHRFSMRLFLSRQHPKGFRRSFGKNRSNLTIVDFWISKEKFLTTYGHSHDKRN
jgi:hypothetical protein